MKFSKKLKQLRLQHNLKQTEIAELCNVTRSAVSNWENNRRFPEIESVSILAKTFNMTVEELLGTDQAAVNLQELEKDIARTNNKVSYKVPSFFAMLWIVVFSLLLILIAPVVKDKYTEYKNKNTIDMIDANSIEKVELVLKYYNEIVTIPFEEYPVSYLSEENNTDNGKVYVIGNINFSKIFELDIWGIDEYVDMNLFVIGHDGTSKLLNDNKIILLDNKTSCLINNQKEYRIYCEGTYQLLFFIREKTCYLEVFLLE